MEPAMIKGTVFYKAPAMDVEFEPIDATCDGVPITLQSSRGEDGVILKVAVLNAASRDDALTIALEVARTVPKVLTYKLGEYCGSFVCFGDALEQVDPVTGKKVSCWGATFNIVHRFEATPAPVMLNQLRRAELKQFLEQSSRPGYVYYEIFRSALRIDDAASRFMVLYGAILMSIFKDSQEKVDAFVLSKQPSVPTNLPFKNRKSGVPETVYTRLRNEIGHVRPNATIDGTRAEMA